MPIDPSIALQVQPVKMPDPVQAYGNALAMKGHLQQQQLQRQQMQQNALELEEKRRDMLDQDILRDAYGQAGGDLDKFQELVRGRVSAKTAQAVTNSILDTKTKLANLSEADLRAYKEHNQLLGTDAQTVLAAPAEQRPVLYQNIRLKHVQEGRIKPEELPDAYPGDDALQVFVNQSRTADQTLDWEAKQRAERRAVEAHAADMAARTAQLPGLQASSLLKGIEAAGQTAPENQAEWTNWRASLSPEVQRMVNPMFSPAERDRVQALAITPQQKAQAEEASRHNRATEDRAAQALEEAKSYHDRSLAMRNQIARSGQNTQFLFREMDKHDVLQKQEQEEWARHQALGDQLSLSDGTKFYTLSGNERVMGPAEREAVRTQYQASDTKAKQLAEQQKQIRQRYGWGEFGKETPAAGGEYSTSADNNPLNITLGAATQKYVDSGQATVKEAKGHKFLSFKDPVAGINAGRDLLFGPTYAGKKAGQALMDWSNGDYGPEVVRQAGIDPKVTIGSLNQQQRDALVAAMAPREGWKGALPATQQAAPPPQEPPVAVASQPPKPSALGGRGGPAAAAPAATPRQAPPPATPPPAAAPAKAPAPAAPRVGQRFSNGKITVKWDGQQYIDEATGKPAKF